jgi:hypothetical protein
MKLDMGRAWNDALLLLRGNQQVVLIVAGVFFFLPNLALLLLMSDTMGEAEARVAGETDPSAMFEMIGTLYGEIWWQALIVTLLSAVGMLGLLALLTDHNRPTVGEALKAGVTYLLPYVGAVILTGFVVGLIVLLAIVVASVAGAAAGVLMGIVAVVALLYVYTKFSLMVPVIVAEEVMNPIRALRRSWSLTKGNSVRLFLFYVLIFVVFFVVMMVFGIVGSVLGLIAGEDANIIVSGLISAAANMIGLTLYLAVLAAVHRQLSGGAKNVGATFE